MLFYCPVRSVCFFEFAEVDCHSALINADIGPSAQIARVATIWAMGSSIGFLVVGRLSDLYGRKWMVMSTTLLGLIGCVIGGTAKSIGMLIASKGCNGLAAAGQLSFSIVLGELVLNKHRGLIMGFVFPTSIPFGVFGPAVARTMIENLHEGWRCSRSSACVLLLLFGFHHVDVFAFGLNACTAVGYIGNVALTLCNSTM